MKSWIIFVAFVLLLSTICTLSCFDEIQQLNLLKEFQGGKSHGNNGTVRFFFPCFWEMTLYKVLLTLKIFNLEKMFTQISLIKAAGYPSETHIVTTEDGYILQMHRIPYSKNDQFDRNPTTGSRPVVFLQHGLMGSSEKWVLSWSKPTESLGSLTIIQSFYNY